MRSPASLHVIGLAFIALSSGGCGLSEKPARTNAAPMRVAAHPAKRPPAPPAPAASVLSSAAQAIPSWARSAVFHRVKIGPQEKCIALTFDDGPWPHSTKEILQILDEHHAKATFFMIGEQIRPYASIARAVRDAGHAIGNHSWNHPSRPKDPKAQIEKTDMAIRDVLQITPTIFRPPYGIETNGLEKWAKAAHEAVLIWSVDTSDWSRPGTDRIVSRAVRGAAPGAIVLMHDGGGDRHQTVAALPEILDQLEEKGYRFVTIPQLLSMRREEPRGKNLRKSEGGSLASGGSLKTR